jgi:glycosyltransferase involved in cell wall biosynthesis
VRLRILLIADPLITVPPLHYGGIERVAADLAAEFSSRGHDVTLWAAPGSHTSGRVVAFGRAGEWTRWSNVRNVSTLSWRFLHEHAAFDVIHNFGRLAYLVAALRRPVAKIQTYMRRVNPANMRHTERLGARHLRFTAVSEAIRETGFPGGGKWHVVYNSAEPSRYVFRADVDPATAPLVFLGRFERCKGAHSAIEVARRTGRTLVLAGTRSTLGEEQHYFDTEIQPQIDGERVRYVGPVDDEQKVALLGSAAALLLPVEWLEPFPVVLPEALLCGTPVLGFRRGGVPEGIEHGRTGFVCVDVDAMVEAVDRLGGIDRRSCRLVGEQRFSTAAVADAYEEVYDAARHA